jgi:hypothetical protein
MTEQSNHNNPKTKLDNRLGSQQVVCFGNHMPPVLRTKYQYSIEKPQKKYSTP